MSLFKNNTYEFYDSYFDSKANDGSFFTISSAEHLIQPFASGRIGLVELNIDNIITMYERKVYSLYQLISDIGGLSQIILILFSLVTRIYTNKLYEFEAVSEFNRAEFNYIQKDAQSDQLKTNDREKMRQNRLSDRFSHSDNASPKKLTEHKRSALVMRHNTGKMQNDRYSQTKRNNDRHQNYGEEYALNSLARSIHQN